MPITRRDFIKLGVAGLGALALPLGKARASGATVRAGSSASMLYDSVKCVGCRACQVACKARSNLPPVLDSNKLYEAPTTLSAYTWTLIELYKGADTNAFVKRQCMHCIDPACVSVCPVGALEKLESGPVIYHKERCIGCRYCMAACPFGIPKSQWDKTLPLIQKCDFCADRLANGQQPACGAACPTGALIYGNRGTMIETAYKRLSGNSDYTQHVYGENEVGGTSMLYIARTNYKNLGLPELNEQDLPPITWPYMEAVPGVIAVMVTLCTGIYLRTHRRVNGASKKEA